MAEGVSLVRYQGARQRRSATTTWSCRELAYQSHRRLWQAKPNGTVRLTAFSVRLRASPTPVIYFAASKATSIYQREAYRSTISGAVARRSVLMRTTA